MFHKHIFVSKKIENNIRNLLPHVRLLFTHNILHPLSLLHMLLHLLRNLVTQFRTLLTELCKRVIYLCIKIVKKITYLL